MRPELRHWFWYEKFTTLFLKECPLIEFMTEDRKAKISDLLKQVSYEIAGGLRYKVDEAKAITEAPKPVERSEIDPEAIEKLKKLEM